MDFLTSGQVAAQADVNVQTIRFYERKGLLEEPPRSKSGYRQYSTESVTRIRFIKHAQEFGFSLKDIQELLSLRVDRRSSCSDVSRQAEAKIADIEQKLQSLRRMRRVLRELVAACGTATPTGDCPILEVLDASNGRWKRQNHQKRLTSAPYHLGK